MVDHTRYDFVIIGSGFGGSVSALRLAEKGYRVLVVEQGQRWSPRNLPKSNWNLRQWLWVPFLRWKGFFSIRFFRHLVVLHGTAVGGGSITYANTLLEPEATVWRDGSWAKLGLSSDQLAPYYAMARKMLGVTSNKQPGFADASLLEMAKRAGVEASFRLTDVGVYFGGEGEAPGTLHSDPYFQGMGPERKSCIGCGGCMIGCQHLAKNTLDLNYLFLAERRGVEVREGTCVCRVEPEGDDSTGGQGYLIRTTQGALIRTQSVVFAASSLGTQELLLRMKKDELLPRLSGRVGDSVRTNSEALIGLRYPYTKNDFSTGIAIGSGIFLRDGTHIEATRYPVGADAMGLLATVMTLGRPGWHRMWIWIRTLVAMLIKEPRKTLRSLIPFGFAREAMILLCMQTINTELKMRLERCWWAPWRWRMNTAGASIPAFIPEANAFAIQSAQATNGIAMTSIPDILLNIPMTAHCLGGAVMASDESQGVCDGQMRVFGYKNMWICDGSVIGANLGVNPSLTITALAEYAMSLIPEKIGRRDGN